MGTSDEHAGTPDYPAGTNELWRTNAEHGCTTPDGAAGTNDEHAGTTDDPAGTNADRAGTNELWRTNADLWQRWRRIWRWRPHWLQHDRLRALRAGQIFHCRSFRVTSLVHVFLVSFQPMGGYRQPGYRYDFSCLNSRYPLFDISHSERSAVQSLLPLLG